MSDFALWPEKAISVPSLLLDPKNPRMPTASGSIDQRTILADLLLYDRVYELARDIAEGGYFPTELLIGLEEGRRKLILEGNRRLAALKLLLNPELAPKQFIKRFEALKASMDFPVTRVRVVFAPSREEAAPIIVKRHTVGGVKRWERAQQARYIRGLLEDGESISALSRRLRMPRGDLSSILRLDELYQVAKSLDLPDHVRKAVHDPRSFNLSALERFSDSSTFATIAGIEFDETGHFKGRAAKTEFKRMYARIVTDIVDGTADTRKLNTDAEIRDYLNGLGTDKPDLRKRGSFDSGELVSDAPTEDQDEEPAPKKERKARQQKALIPPSVKCTLSSPRIQKLFGELKRLSVPDYPNACGVTFRVFFELLIAHYMDATGRIKPLLDRHNEDLRKQASKGRPVTLNEWYPTLRQNMTALLQDDHFSSKLNPQARKAMKHMASEKYDLLTIDRMDQFIHNEFNPPTELQLRTLWAATAGFLEHLLDEPAQEDMLEGARP